MKRKYYTIFAAIYLIILCTYSVVIASDTKSNNLSENKYFFGTTNIKISNLKDLASVSHDLSVPEKNYMIRKERGGGWVQGVKGIVFSPVVWSHETTFYVPSEMQRYSIITSGIFVEYTGSERWRWSIKETKETKVGKGGLLHREKAPSFVVTVVFQPYRPEPPSVVTSRKNSNIKSTDCWWFPPLYISPASIKLISENEKDRIITPLGVIVCPVTDLLPLMTAEHSHRIHQTWNHLHKMLLAFCHIYPSCICHHGWLLCILTSGIPAKESENMCSDSWIWWSLTLLPAFGYLCQEISWQKVFPELIQL